MTDGDVVKIARRIDDLREKIDDLIYQISDSDHPNAEQLSNHLLEECWFAAWATHVVHDYLAHPERWEADNYGIRRRKSSADERTEFVGLCEFEALLG